MKKGTIVILSIVAAVVLGIMWGVGINNKLVGAEENVSKAWSDVENQYKRRMDLIPQLMATVQGAADFEITGFTKVTQARSNASSVQMDPSNLSEADIAKFQQAQDALSSALSHSINVVVERYPELSATQAFRDMQAQLEGTENRIAVARQRFNEEVNTYNRQLRIFPNNIIASLCGFEKKGYFTAPAEAENPVEVRFDFDK